MVKQPKENEEGKAHKGRAMKNGSAALELDDKDELILSAIRQHPDQDLLSLAETGELKSIPYPTIAKRVKNLTKVNVLRRLFVVHLIKAGYTHRYRIDVVINPSELHKVPAPAESGGGASQKPEPDYITQQGLADYIKNSLTKDKELEDDVVVEDVHILLGTEPDLSIDVYTRDPKRILEFVTDGVRKLRGVYNTRTAELAWSIRDHQES